MPASTKFRTALRRKSCMTRPEHPAATQAAAQVLNRSGRRSSSSTRIAGSHRARVPVGRSRRSPDAPAGARGRARTALARRTRAALLAVKEGPPRILTRSNRRRDLRKTVPPGRIPASLDSGVTGRSQAARRLCSAMYYRSCVVGVRRERQNPAIKSSDNSGGRHHRLRAL